MSQLHITSDITVRLLRSVGTDADIAAAARVSTGSESPEKIEGLIRYLMKHRHGSPFEHNSMTFEIHAPIVVSREFVRHRIGVSISEASGRYTDLEPTYYTPSDDRKTVRVGTAARPSFEAPSEDQARLTREALHTAYMVGERMYRRMVDAGVSTEVARLARPQGLYTRWHSTLNLRSALNFLSLRTHRQDATAVSYPQREIEIVAEQMEAFIAELFPIAMAAFNENGRVAP